MRQTSHWTCVDLDAEATLPDWLSRISRYGRAIINQASRRSQDAPPPAPGEVVFALAYPETELRALALLVSDRDGEGGCFWRLACSYPLAVAGAVRRLRLDRVIEDDGGSVAVIEASTPGGARIAFFDSLYFMQRDSYRTGESYDFVLSGLAYALQVVRPEPLRIAERAPAEARVAGGNGAVAAGEALSINLAGSAMLFPIETGNPDDYLFQAPVREVSQLSLEGRSLLRIRATVLRLWDGDLDLPIFASTALLAGERPRPGDDISGALWLQGYRQGSLPG